MTFLEKESPMENSTYTWEQNDSFPLNIIGSGILIGILAGLVEGAIVSAIMNFFGLYERMPIFG